MNLFHSPYLSQLSILIAGCTNNSSYYDIIVDHDGEVLIEPSSKRKSNNLPKYKFYFKNFLHGRRCARGGASTNLSYLNQLYKNLMYCWENEMSGSINYNEITLIRNYNYHLEINSYRKASEHYPIASLFLKPTSPTARQYNSEMRA